MTLRRHATTTTLAGAAIAFSLLLLTGCEPQNGTTDDTPTTQPDNTGTTTPGGTGTTQPTTPPTDPNRPPTSPG